MSKEGKKERFARPLRALGGFRAIEDDGSRPDLNVEMLALSKIEIDPENPRGLGLDPHDLRVAEDDPEVDRKREALAELEELAASIMAVGLLQPITVYPHGSGYRIATGERRYLAHVLAGLPSIKSTIRETKPAQLRLVQLVENAHRSDLTLWRRIENIRAVMAELEEEGKPITSAEELGQQLAYRRSTAFNWWSLVRAPADVLDDIREGRVTFAAALTLARAEDPEERTRIRQRMAGQGPVVPPAPTPKRAAAGRPLTKVALGSTTNPAVVRKLLEALRGPKAFAAVDWDDRKVVAAVFRQVLKELEMETHA